ncbi:MAG: photosynthetic reaction center subunit M [Candidatus Roseilinea sp.]|uniref:photosynthetic reaction center subunit M n=1 Tax=Candidatus Roseilinea sp. TaxID=2838777 RepID=UPI00404B6661
MASEITRVESADWRTTRRFYLKFLEGLADTQVGPIYIGVWGILAVFFFAVTVFIILFGYLQQVGYNPVLFVREFPVLSVEPPPPSYGLRLAPLAEGGYWQIATFFLTLSIVFWLIRIWSRAVANKLRPTVPIVFTSAIFLYAAIYIIHPISMNSWNEAPGHGLRAQLVWANAFSIKYGNFYYNPFHMVSIFGLLGSCLLLAMHGATILAALRLNAHREIDEAESSTEGTHRAQLLWRWVMGFNATATSIHTWAIGIAVVSMVAGALGVIFSGTLEPDWFQWACRAGIVPGVIQPGTTNVAACLQ